MSTVLVVDDEASICWALERALSEDGHAVLTAATAEDAFNEASVSPPDVVIMDIRLPGMDGLSALEQLRERLATTPVIIMTAFGNLETAVHAINRGAFEYLTKPFDLEDAVGTIRRALESTSTSQPETRSDSVEGFLLGSSPAMQDVFRKIALVAGRDVPVLITGESGTGKELVATAIHRYSRRSEAPFIPVCVPALNESLVESELFGHSQGAFTGAAHEREGLLRAAHMGTAFFDEIGDISIATQVKLLRVLETKTVTPVGSSRSQQTDFRLVAATNLRLEEMVQSGSFREDLFYRLNVFRIEIPPLRQRREDIPLLAQHFLNQITDGEQPVFSDEAIKELLSRPWHGNVRELRNAVEYAVVMTRSAVIDPESLPPPISDSPPANRARHSLQHAVRHWLEEKLQHTDDPAEEEGLFDSFSAAVEPVLLNEVLQLTNGNRMEAARLLGIHRQTLRSRLKRHGLDSSGD